MYNEQISSTGGRIIQTKTGLIHYGNTDKFITDEYKNVTGVNGRPSKEDTKLKYSFSAFGTVTIPQWTGSSTVHEAK
jgi:hypothetical protein